MGRATAPADGPPGGTAESRPVSIRKYLFHYPHFLPLARSLSVRIIKLMMNTDLKTQALQLPAEERLELADFLIESTLPALTDEQKAQLDKRLAAYKANPGRCFQLGRNQS